MKHSQNSDQFFPASTKKNVSSNPSTTFFLQFLLSLSFRVTTVTLYSALEVMRYLRHSTNWLFYITLHYITLHATFQVILLTDRQMPTLTWSHKLLSGSNKLCGRPPQYAPAPASWPSTFWPWKWCPSHVWRGLPFFTNFSLRPLCSRLRPDVRDWRVR